MKKEKPLISKLLHWVDNNLLWVLASFLFIFIPLYPKLPLFDAIPGYIVRVRIEDFLILFTVIFWLIQLIRKKVTVHPLVTKLIFAYAIIGFLSTLSAIFITKTVPLSEIHIFKLYFHYFRRLEYFSLLFVFYSAIKTKKQAKILILLLSFVMIAVALYGYGQKYLYWPVYSTMNREFSKGWRLYLTEHARVPSTFGGHYDAAAFALIAITISVSLLFFAKNRWHKLIGAIAFGTGLWLLVLTASRTSNLAYLFALFMLALLALFYKEWRKWVIPKWLIVTIISITVMLSFGDLSERFTQLLGLHKIRDQFSQILLTAKINKPENGIALDDIEAVSSASDTPPSTAKPTPKPDDNLPPDVYEKIPVPVAETTPEGTPTGKIVSGDRTFSDNAYKYGLSVAIRLDALWPRAWQGFMNNPLLGSGYSTLTKESVDVFTEAESTDNDFLRNLGETGLLGFISFFGTIVVIMYLAFVSAKKIDDPLPKAFLVGFAAASCGLLLNASYIDVLEASKVAEIYWALAGISLIIPTLYADKKPKNPKKHK